MDTKKEIARITEQMSTGDYSQYSFDELLSQYDIVKAVEAFENTPSQYVPAMKKAKEIALQASLTVFSPHNAKADEIVDAAEKIYLWLIK